MIGNKQRYDEQIKFLVHKPLFYTKSKSLRYSKHAAKAIRFDLTFRYGVLIRDLGKSGEALTASPEYH